MTSIWLALAAALGAPAANDNAVRQVGPRKAYPARADGATRVSERWALPPFAPVAEPRPTESLADALDAAYRTSPALQAQRYELRASDEDYALALAETRPTTQLQVSGGYTHTVAGRITQSQRSLVDRLNSPSIDSNNASAQLTVDQPIYTGGRAASDREVANYEIGAGRAQLRGVEGDIFLQVITSYADVRRDTRALGLREANLKQLEATLAEVKARQEAGELTRTDIAQAETQLDFQRTQFNSASQQLEQDRATYAALVGHDAGVLAPEPGLPQLPTSIDKAFDVAGRLNPDLLQQIASERESRSRIGAAAAQGRPQLSVRGTATFSGQALPFYSYNYDRGVSGQAVLTLPITNGGRIGALVAQARDRNAADRNRIEEARRRMVQSIVSSWDAVATAQRNVMVGTAQIASARVLNEGTFEEYRAGLRSTFDVLFAQGSLRDAEIALVAARHDLYVAQATLLRQMGLLEARTLLTATPLQDSAENLRHANARGALPWDGIIRSIDRIGRPQPDQGGLEQPALPTSPPAILRAPTLPLVNPTSHSPEIALPGTSGAPRAPGTLKHP